MSWFGRGREETERQERAEREKRELLQRDYETKRRADDEARALGHLRKAFAKLSDEDRERVVLRISDPDAGPYNDFRYYNINTQIYQDATRMAERMALVREALNPTETP